MARPVPYLVDTSFSRHARLRPVPLGAVRLNDALWEPRRRRNREVTLPSQYRKCEETGRIDNFRRAAGKIGGAFRGRYYNDSDVYKWIEACAFALADGPDPELERLTDLVIAEITDAQGEDGYLNTHFTHEREGERWSNLKDLHELYCAGHLIQAAIAHFRCTGKTRMMDVALRCADHLCDLFGPGGRNGTCGHQQIEMAFVELYRLTREERYLHQARLFIERRGQRPPVLGGGPYHQDHQPFRELDAVTGHAVRMVYYCCGAADVVLETGDPDYRAALDRLWDNMTTRRMYVTGGIGSRYEGEAFGEDYELPNDRAYAESCAAIGSVMWNWRLLQLTADAKYADLIENTLYNAVLPSLSLDGEQYFYQNPLADAGTHRRQPWFECACCPPNIARLLASLPAYFYSTGDNNTVWIHLFAEGEASIGLADGRTLTLRQRTNYPWDGAIEITAELDEDGPVPIRLRIPGWANNFELTVNGEPVETAVPGDYAEAGISATGDVICLRLEMKPTVVESHPYVANNVGRAALRRGPLLYCAEQVDLGTDPRDVVLPRNEKLRADWEPDLLGGIVTLTGPAFARDQQSVWTGALYAQDEERPDGQERPIEFRAIPYFAWANRQPGGMAVWLRRK